MTGIADYENLPSLIGRLVSGGMASLIELQTVYSLEDAMQLDEIPKIKNYHEWLATRKQDG